MHAMNMHACNEYAWSKKRGVFENFSGSAGTPRTDATQLLQSMGAITGGVGVGVRTHPKNRMDPLTFYVAIGAGLVGVTDCPKLGIPFYFFLEKGSNTPDREVRPPNFENAVAPLL